MESAALLYRSSLAFILLRLLTPLLACVVFCILLCLSSIFSAGPVFDYVRAQEAQCIWEHPQV